MNAPDRTAGGSRRDALEHRLGLAVARTLSVRARQLEPDVAERLRFAREQAAEVARVRRLALQPVAQPALAVGGGGTLGWWGRLGTVLPAAALVAGLVLIQAWHESAQIQAAAEIDAALLADDVPVDAYADPGFIEFLKEGRR